ncbi:MAG: porin [Gammaproteobacteria bacterium]|nr:porin [Gammaproteobacteria bacterium]
MQTKQTQPVLILALIMGTSIAEAADTTIELGGYIKLDAMLTNYNNGQPASTAIDDFYIPSLVPVGGEKQDTKLNTHAKQTRFNIKSNTKLENGQVLKGLIEVDFGPGQATENGEATTNRSTLGLRHAVFTYGNWTFGQTWSTAINGASIADTLDFFALAEGMVDPRQVQVRYSSGPFSIGLEKPLTTLDGRIEAKDSIIPDVVLRYNMKGGYGDVSVSGIFRKLAYKTDTFDATETATGLSVAGRLNAIGKDDIRFILTAGTGLGRWVGLAMNPDAYVSGDELKVFDQLAFNAAYLHHWNDKSRTTFGVAAYKADADDDAPIYNEQSSSIHLNYLYNPVTSVTLGVEYLHAELEKSSGTKGDMDRLQFSAKYAF